MAMVVYTRLFLAFLIFHDHAEAFPNPINAARSIIVPAATNEERIHQDVGISEEETKVMIEQRNLRFGGVGRLYTTTDDIAAATSSGSSIEPHLAVVERLAASTVIVVGLGGVGSWAAEALCRSGVGSIALIDLDDICISNTNRQSHALSSTIGKMKIDEMKRRLHDINPHCNVTLIHDFVSPENVYQLLSGFSGKDRTTACLDAIDGSIAKSALLTACSDLRIPIVTCGGTAGRQDPTKLVCDDLTRASGDRLLSACRKTLRQYYGFPEGLDFHETRRLGKAPKKWKIHAVFSTETHKSMPPDTDVSALRRCDGVLGTASFVTGTAGFIAAGKVVDMITKNKLRPPVRRKMK